MIFGRIACLGVLVFLSFGIRAAHAGQCLFGGPHYQLQSDSVEWRMEIRSGQSCIQGVRFNNVTFHSINLTSPPRSGRVTLLGSAFAYTAKPDFEGEDTFALSVSGAIRRASGTSTIRIIVSVVGAATRAPAANAQAPATAPTPPMTVQDVAIAPKGEHRMLQMSRTKFEDWSSRWEKGMILEAPNRYCETAMGEEIGWLLGPILEGYYYGYLATNDTKWVDLLINCADSWIARALKEPDGYLGWPKFGAAGADVDGLNDFYADSMLGEAMALRPITLLSGIITRTPVLAEKYGSKANDYIKFSGQVFEKWNSRGAWREISPDEMISIYLPFGIDRTHNAWTAGYQERYDPTVGFSHQDNKANLVASWLLALFDATQMQIYRDRAEQWFRIMKSRMKLKEDGTYQIWNYWEPAGRWDYKPNGLTKHWVGVHPSAGYYGIDVEAIVTAYEHRLVFTADDIKHLISTALSDGRYWSALVPYDDAIQRHFEETLDPGSWNGHSKAPWYLALELRNGLLP